MKHSRCTALVLLALKPKTLQCFEHCYCLHIWVVKIDKLSKLGVTIQLRSMFKVELIKKMKNKHLFAKIPYHLHLGKLKLWILGVASLILLITVSVCTYSIDSCRSHSGSLALCLFPPAPALALSSISTHYKVLLVLMSLHSMAPPCIFPPLHPYTPLPICSPPLTAGFAPWMTGL